MQETSRNVIDIGGDSQGGGRGESDGKGVDDMGSVTANIMAPEDTRPDVSAHKLCKKRTPTMFEVCIINKESGSYPHMAPGKAF